MAQNIYRKEAIEYKKISLEGQSTSVGRDACLANYPAGVYLFNRPNIHADFF